MRENTLSSLPDRSITAFTQNNDPTPTTEDSNALKERIAPDYGRVDWTNVDWTLQDVVLAEQLGCSRQRVHQKRRELKKPRALKHYATRPHMQGNARPAQEKFRSWLEGKDASKYTLSEMERLAGVSVSAVKIVLESLNLSARPASINGKLTKPEKYDWSLIADDEWATMTNKEIAERLGNPKINVSAYRIRHNHPKGPRRVT